MPPRTDLFIDRQRANSFGAAAQRYDSHRPRYPDALIDDLIAPGVRHCLDVGAGTGIATRQFADRGISVLAVEPDERMATVARGKMIPVEVATFERWEPAGRQFDLVVFAASFHWVDPAVALPKVAQILTSGGRLALIWNRLSPVRPPDEDLRAISRNYLPAEALPREHDSSELLDGLLNALRSEAFEVKLCKYPVAQQYSREQWLELLFTYSSYLTLPRGAAAELRRVLAERIGEGGVTIGGDALAIVATPDRLLSSHS